MADLSQLQQLILQTDNAARAASEETLNNLIQTDPTAVFTQLLGFCNQQSDLQQLSLIIIKKKFLDTGLYTNLDINVRTQGKQTLLNSVSFQQSQGIMKTLANVIVHTAELDGWIAELFSKIGEWSQNQEIYYKSFIMTILQLATDYDQLMATLKSSINDALAMVTPYLQLEQLKVEAVQTLAMLITGLESEDLILQYQSLATNFVQVVSQSLTDMNLGQALTSLAELTEMAPRFWMNSMPITISVLSQIALNQQCEEDIRASAVELATTILIRAPGIIKSDEDVVKTLLQMGLELTNEVDYPDDLAEWNANEEQEVTQNDPYSLGRDLLNKLATNLGGDIVLPCLLQIIPTLLKDARWTSQNTGVITLGIIAEGCHKRFKENLAEILQMIVPFAYNENPRLKFAAVTTLGLLCTEFEPIPQQKYHSDLLQAIIHNIQPANLKKVKIQAVGSIINYAKGLISDDDIDVNEPLGQYANQLLGQLATLLQSGIDAQEFDLVKETLGAISMISNALQATFAQFYSSFMGALKNLLQMTVQTPAQQEVRAATIRCIGYLIDSVSDLGAEYQEEGKVLMNGLMTLKSQLPAEDPAQAVISEVLGSFASLLKDQFTPYVDSLLPELLQQAQLSIDMSLLDADEAARLPSGMKSINLDLGGHGTKALAIHTTALQNKIQACKIIYDLVNCMGVAYGKYTQQTVQVMQELFTYMFNTDVRKYSVLTVANSISTMETQQQKEALLLYNLPFFRSALAQQERFPPKDTKRLLRGIQTMFEEVNQISVITLAGATELSQSLANVVNEVFKRKAERHEDLAKYNNNEIYTEELEMLRADDKVDDYILRTNVELVSKMLQSFNSQYQPIFAQYFTQSYFNLLTKQEPTEGECLASICMFADYIQYTKDLMSQNGQLPLLEHMLRFSSSSNVDIRQTGIYGVGICCQNSPSDVILPYIDQCYAKIQEIVRDPNAFTEDNIMATENAIGAWARIALTHRQDLIGDFLNYLPLKNDEEEARNIHKLVVENYQVLQGNPNFVKLVVELKAQSPKIVDEPTRQFLASF